MHVTCRGRAHRWGPSCGRSAEDWGFMSIRSPFRITSVLTGRSRGLRSAAIRWFDVPEKTPTESI